jgi:hypothetical protein
MADVELVLCVEHPREWSQFNPCPLEKGHEGPHVYWQQSKPHAKRGRNGVTVYDETGKAVVHATFDGAVQAEVVCALLGMSEAAALHLARDPRRRPDDPNECQEGC